MSRTSRGLISMLCLLSISATTAVADSRERKQFDHLGQTGFDLTPVHRLAQCADCHLHNLFEGTPRTCRGCHGSQGIRTASRKGAQHIRSTDNCELCHMDFTANSWAPVRRVDHLEVRGSCYGCHNGMVATGKHNRHVPSSNRCDNCHKTRSWIFSPFRHNVLPGYGAGNCASCHNGFFAEGKNPGHLPSNNRCDDCHNTRVWNFAPFDHHRLDGSGAGICHTCHNGRDATGKHARHIPSSNQCDDCHQIHSWQIARFDHAVLPASGAGQCQQCHGPGGLATITKPPAASHIRDSGIEPTNVCDACHLSTATWTLVRMDHDQIGNDGVVSAGGSSARCFLCHFFDRPPVPPHPSNNINCAKAGCHQSTTDWCITPLGPVVGLCGN